VLNKCFPKSVLFVRWWERW